jgi:uncharacterized membrane protein
MSTRDQLISLIEQRAIPAHKLDDALATAQLFPDKKSWQGFIDKLLLLLGSLSIVFALLFFIAYNWQDIGRFAKFGLVQVFMLLALAAYWKWNLHPFAGKVALMVASIALGVLLALYGQTYQTGADPWQLFFNWCLLMLPWTLIARFPALWILWLTLLNLSCVLYYKTFNGIFATYFSETELLWLLLAINTLAFICWEFLTPKLPWLNESWALRAIALGSGTPATWLALHSIFAYNAGILPLLMWAAFIGGLFFYYRKRKVDLFMLAGGCLSGIVVIVSLVAKGLSSNIGVDAGIFLLLAILVVGLSTGAAFWLGSVHKEQQL